MRRVIATFSGAAYNPTTKLLLQRYEAMGADEVRVFDDRWLVESGYVVRNQWLFEATSQIQGEGTVYKHGFGWCSWKAFVILSAWDRLQDGDIVLYLDA